MASAVAALAAPGCQYASCITLRHVSRYTDPEMLEIYVAAAAGQVNKRVSVLQRWAAMPWACQRMAACWWPAESRSPLGRNGRQRVVR
jgi:hypothetical protein